MEPSLSSDSYILIVSFISFSLEPSLNKNIFRWPGSEFFQVNKIFSVFISQINHYVLQGRINKIEVDFRGSLNSRWVGRPEGLLPHWKLCGSLNSMRCSMLWNENWGQLTGFLYSSVRHAWIDQLPASLCVQKAWFVLLARLTPSPSRSLKVGDILLFWVSEKNLPKVPASFRSPGQENFPSASTKML